jgi:hypothetical protein
MPFACRDASANRMLRAMNLKFCLDRCHDSGSDSSHKIRTSAAQVKSSRAQESIRPSDPWMAPPRHVGVMYAKRMATHPQSVAHVERDKDRFQFVVSILHCFTHHASGRGQATLAYC